jgi:hypothetical protein
MPQAFSPTVPGHVSSWSGVSEPGVNVPAVGGAGSGDAGLGAASFAPTGSK